MSLHDVQFPATLDYGSRGGPTRSTSIIQLDSGAEERVARWAASRRRYRVATIKKSDDVAVVRAFFEARDGRLHDFRMKDWADFTTASDDVSAPSATDVQLAVGDNTTKEFQLQKFYSSGGSTKIRYITLPVQGTVLVALDGTPKTEGVDYTVGYTTGKILFTTAPALNVAVSAGCEFDTRVRFEQDELEIEIRETNQYRIRNLTMIESLESSDDPEDFDYGGGLAFVPMGADVRLSLGGGRAVLCQADTPGLKVFLPPLSEVRNGAVHFVIYNTGSQSLVVRDDLDTTTIATIPASNNYVEVIVTPDGSGNKSWRTLS